MSCLHSTIVSTSSPQTQLLTKFLSGRSLTTSLVLNPMDIFSPYLILTLKKNTLLIIPFSFWNTLNFAQVIVYWFSFTSKISGLLCRFFFLSDSARGLPPNYHTFPKSSPIPSISIYMLIPPKSLLPVQRLLQTCIIFLPSIIFSQGHSRQFRLKSKSEYFTLPNLFLLYPF